MVGLTKGSVGTGTVDNGLEIRKRSESDRVVAIAGNPNVGKSTVFNALTGLNQHTGNWPGKTVTNAQGYHETRRHSYVLVDIPGTYSLMAHSAEEEVARNFICFGEAEAVIVVCDATCLERNLNLVLQTIELTDRVLVCVNLMDEAKRKQIKIDLPLLSRRLGVPVVGTTARKKRSLAALTAALDEVIDGAPQESACQVVYAGAVEEAIGMLLPAVREKTHGKINARWLSLKLLDYDDALLEEVNACLGCDLLSDADVSAALQRARDFLSGLGIHPDDLKEKIVSHTVKKAEEICRGVVQYEKSGYDARDRRLDRILTSRFTGYPIMLLLLACIFWLTITGANYPSQFLSKGLFWIQDRLTEWFQMLGAPEWLHGMLVLGVYRVLAWVVSVMLPPMAIFFPLFTLLEDSGYLPRIAYNLDRPFQHCHACGKQALTMCMGFGCNAAGVVGCRIIDSPRERLIAMLTNSFVPCNGRFPTIITILSLFFLGSTGGMVNSVLSALFLTCVILLGVFMTFAVSKLLSRTILKGVPSSFTLELPSYRMPQIGRVIVRSICDRTLFVLGRAAAVAAPAGLIIWLMANVQVGELSLLSRCAGFLDPFARCIGLDGVLLMAFLLGFPANEIVVPIALMAYLAEGSIVDIANPGVLRQILTDNGWTWVTAVCVILFSLMHWPCSTTLWTIRKESGSWRWTALAAVLPTAAGMLLCFLIAAAANLFC